MENIYINEINTRNKKYWMGKLCVLDTTEVGNSKRRIVVHLIMVTITLVRL